MKMKTWSGQVVEMTTGDLMDGRHESEVEFRIARLERIIAMLMDKLALTEQQKFDIFRYECGVFSLEKEEEEEGGK
jgi:hypothetical protein